MTTAEMTENLVRLKLVNGLGSAVLWRLLKRFGNSDRVLGAPESDLAAVPGMTRAKAQLVQQAAAIDPRPEMEKAVAAGIAIIPYDDPSYPKPLLHTFDPPAVLYVRGSIVDDDQVAVGIVGTRRASVYGREQALRIADALSRGGFTIVSGLARGIDTFAHTGALDAGGRTIGVLGCGFDYMYPEENRDLALEMTAGGAVVSEFPMATPPARDTFPARNRIIAGMSLGLVVIEAPLRSGSLITARLANEIGRPVFAVPGRVGDACSEGCNKLIRDGATMVMSMDDIFNELNPTLPPPPPEPAKAGRKAGSAGRGGLFEKAEAADAPAPKPASKPLPTPALTDEQRAVLRCLTAEWKTADDIVEACGLPSGRAAAALSMLKIMRLAEQGPGQVHRLRNGGA